MYRKVKTILLTPACLLTIIHRLFITSVQVPTEFRAYPIYNLFTFNSLKRKVFIMSTVMKFFPYSYNIFCFN